uniref:Uncharacterized protein n=1 Tax=Neoizziella asiatica TaxID=1077397 RepID=A0A1G4NWM9_9FLOR|nr:Hypothetical protein ycf37 [Neoizziella asiatica]SCW23113.1 Hypothetical protein ycf37 [Neoizziella asiatica]
MPILYLICLSCMLTPLSILLILQNIRFYKSEKHTSNILINSKTNFSSTDIKCYLSQQYIKKHQWLNAIIILENLNVAKPTRACSQQIGNIMKKNSYHNLADKYLTYAQNLEAINSESSNQSG